MFSFIFRVAGFFILALSLMLAVLDVTRSLTASALVLTPMAQTWADISPTTLLASKEMITGWALPFLWDPVATTLLVLPSWLFVCLVAMILLKLSQKRGNPYGRFASR